MNLRYWLKSAIKNMILFRSKRRYTKYCNAVVMESDRLPNGIGIGYADYFIFLTDESFILRRIYDW